MLTEDVADALVPADADDEFDLDVQVIPSRRVDYKNWLGDPDPSQPGSTCDFSCPHTCGGQCTFQVADPDCSQK